MIWWSLVARRLRTAARCTLVTAFLFLVPLAGPALAQGSCIPIGFGETVPGQISAAAERDCYAFSSATGDRIRVNGVETSGGWDARQEVIRPNGTVLCSTTGGSMDCTVDTPGTHTISVFDNFLSRVGSYNLYLQRLSNPAGCAAVDFDDTIASSVPTAAAEVCHSFTGVAGHRIRVNGVETSGGWDARQEVIRPNGTVLCSTTGGSLDCTIDAAGPHTVFVFDNFVSRAGSYNLYLQRLVDPVGCGIVPYGDTVSGSIVGAAEQNCHSFSGTPGDRVRVNGVETSGGWDARQEVIRPNGTVLCSTTGGSMDCTLDGSGSHTIFVFDNFLSRVGSYNLYLQRLNDPIGCSALAFDDTASGAIGAAAQEVCHSWSGVAGNRFRVNGVETSTGWDAAQEVIRPNGTVLCSTTGGSIDCTLDTSGVHTIFVSDNFLSRAGTYNVYLQRLVDPPGCAPIDFGNTVSGSIDEVAQENCHAFEGRIGDRIRVNGVETSSGWDARQEVLRPDGTVLCSTTGGSMDCSLDRAGLHSIFVFDNFLSRVGTYNLYLQRLNPPAGCAAIAFDDTVSSSVTAAAQEVCHFFTGSPGDRVRVNGVETSGGWDARQEVIRPNGTVLCSTTGGSMDCTLDQAGVHAIFVFDNFLSRTGSYNLYLQRITGPFHCEAIGFGEVVAGSIEEIAEANCYRFDGAPGDRIRVNGVETSGGWDARQEVIRPNGTVLCSTTGGSMDCTLDAGGPNLILVFDNFLSRVGTYDLSLQRLNNPVGCTAIDVGSTVSGAIILPAEENCYSFSASAGHRVRITGVETSSGWDARQEVIRPNGTVLCSTTAASMDCTLDTSGPHAIFVFDNFRSRTGTYNLGLACLVTSCEPPAVTLSIDDVTVSREGQSGTNEAVFTVSLSVRSGAAVSVKFATANGTAKAGSDYVAKSGTLAFAPGETVKTIAVTVKADVFQEPNETFFVNLSRPVNATVAKTTGTATILDDDPQPSISIDDVAVAEKNSGSSKATFTVTLSRPSSQTVKVRYATGNGTASAGRDYVAKSGTLSFAPGQTTKAISVTVKSDTVHEGNEAFVVNLSNPQNATIADNQGVAAIIDND